MKLTVLIRKFNDCVEIIEKSEWIFWWQLPALCKALSGLRKINNIHLRMSITESVVIDPLSNRFIF